MAFETPLAPGGLHFYFGPSGVKSSASKKRIDFKRSEPKNQSNKLPLNNKPGLGSNQFFVKYVHFRSNPIEP